MNTSEKIKLAAAKQREYNENANKYSQAMKSIKKSFLLSCILNGFVIFSSTYTFFFDTVPKSGHKSLNFGVIQLIFGIILFAFSVLAIYRKDKRFIYIALIPSALTLIFAFFGSTKLRASIHNWCGIPINSYLNIKAVLIIFCAFTFAIYIMMYKALDAYDRLRECDGFPHFSLRCAKLEEYMPDEYTLPEDRISEPDTLSADDIGKYQKIESQTATTYTPGVMDTIGPISLDEE